jgi:hypothetical protein
MGHGLWPRPLSLTTVALLSCEDDVACFFWLEVVGMSSNGRVASNVLLFGLTKLTSLVCVSCWMSGLEASLSWSVSRLGVLHGCASMRWGEVRGAHLGPSINPKIVQLGVPKCAKGRMREGGKVEGEGSQETCDQKVGLAP